MLLESLDIYEIRHFVTNRHAIRLLYFIETPLYMQRGISSEGNQGPVTNGMCLFFDPKKDTHLV